MSTKVAADEKLRGRLAAAGQEHVLTFWGELTETQRKELEGQLGGIDWKGIPGLVGKYVKGKGDAGSGGKVEPTLYYRADGSNWDKAGYAKRGAELVAAGKVAAFTVAGGQGTRLGFDGPKGCYPAGAVTGKPLFACLAEWILAAQKRYCKPGGGGVVIPWYIMTSPINHEPTVEFFRQQKFFGLRESDVMFFPQGVMPSFEMGTGRVLMDQKDAVAVNPDGHGGSIRALAASGALADMDRRGVEQLSYTQIDNPLVRVIDPAFIGLHAFAPDSSGEMSSKMVLKAGPEEKVGVLCRVDGKTAVVEYSDMPVELSRAVNGDGSLKFAAGSIAIHVISTAFLKKLTAGGGGLPYHRAEKKVPFVDLATGKRIEPEKPNAVKLEMFVFDALPLCAGGKSIVLETERVEEFAPIKNASGADSPETCGKIQTERAGRWLRKVGVKVPEDCVLEISPLSALEAGDLQGKGVTVKPGQKLAI